MKTLPKASVGYANLLIFDQRAKRCIRQSLLDLRRKQKKFDEVKKAKPDGRFLTGGQERSDNVARTIINLKLDLISKHLFNYDIISIFVYNFKFKIKK